jgi:hypothetical protein
MRQVDMSNVFSVLKPNLSSRNFSIGCLAALGIVLSTYVPLYGLPASIFEHTRFSQSYSIMAIGIYPWLFTVVVVELFLFIFPDQKLFAKLKTGGHVNPFSVPIVICGLLLTFLYSYNIHQGLVAIAANQNEQVVDFFWVNIPALVAGTALSIWFASLIPFNKMNLGFWLAVVILTVAAFHNKISFDWVTLKNDHASALDYAYWLLALVLKILLIVGFINFRKANGIGDIQNVLWPWLIAPMATSFIFPYVIEFYSKLDWDGAQQNNNLVYGVCTAMIVVSASYIYLRREPLRFWNMLFVLVLAGLQVVDELVLTLNLDTIALFLMAYFAKHLFDQAEEVRQKNYTKNLLKL